MQSPHPPNAGFLAPLERRRQVAAILAQGVVRHRRIAALANSDESSLTRNPGLEVVSKTRLSVSGVRATETRAWENEVNDG